MSRPNPGSRAPEHLTDEAVAAHADHKLTGGAQNRAARHVAGCPECRYAVAVQRQAVWALRAAPAPILSAALLDRLRDVPTTTPIQRVPTHVDEHGTTMFSVSAGFVPATVPPAPHRSRMRGRMLAATVASLAVVGTVAGVAAADSSTNGTPAPSHAPAQLIHEQGRP